MKRFNSPAITLGITILTVFALFACAPKAREKASELDTPEHHTFSGMKLLEKGEYDDALREFNLAIELDRKFSPAHAGLGLAYGYKREFKKAHKHMDKAEDLAKDDEQVVGAKVGYIRLYSMEREKGWLKDAGKAFKKAIKINPESAAAYYYMGKAYKFSYDFDKAGDMFKKVLDLNSDYIAEANAEWELVQKIQRAAPGSKIGKRIALIEEITRADIAALFIQELFLEKLYKKRTPKRFDTSFKAPEDPRKFEADRIVKAEAATDIADHVLRTDIETVMELGVKGLEPGPDHLFNPDTKITRAEYAIMIEDILIKVSGDESIATKFVGSASPFPDLRNDLPYFNAIMAVSSRGIMKPVDLTTGEFAPMKTVSGTDALLIIRNLKSELKFF